MMRIIDMHLNPLVKPDLGRLTQVSLEDLRESSRRFAAQFGELRAERGVMVLLTPTLLLEPGAKNVLDESRQDGKFIFSFAADFRSSTAFEQLEAAHAMGVTLLKFHPYIQGIIPKKFPLCGGLAKKAEALGMGIMVCCSYGTRALNRHSGVRLAAYLSEMVRCPIIMSHAGGAQILDAMLVAADAPNLYLDTSFSLPTYIGSSVETDFAYAMRKLGMARWVYGSDAPFVGMRESLDATLGFLDRHRFSSAETEELFYETAARILC